MKGMRAVEDRSYGTKKLRELMNQPPQSWEHNHHHQDHSQPFNQFISGPMPKLNHQTAPSLPPTKSFLIDESNSRSLRIFRTLIRWTIKHSKQLNYPLQRRFKTLLMNFCGSSSNSGDKNSIMETLLSILASLEALQAYFPERLSLRGLAFRWSFLF